MARTKRPGGSSRDARGANAALRGAQDCARARHFSNDVNAKVGGPPKNASKARPEGVNPVGVSGASPTAPSNGARPK
jgi:hypothetical protein